VREVAAACGLLGCAAMKLAALLAIVPAVAYADAPCTPGRPCSHVMWELGAVMVRFRPEPIDATVGGASGASYHVTAAAGDERPIIASGGSLRTVVGFACGLYFASELDIAGITTGPRLTAEVSDRGVTSSTQSSTGGLLIDVKPAAGWRFDAGTTRLELELAPGVRSAHFTTHDLADRIATPFEVWTLVEVHARVAEWVSPHISVAAQVGTDLLRTHDVSAGLMIGLHRDRYR